MTVKELLAQTVVQDRLSDSLETGYTTQELVAYLNDAINFIWHVLIAKKYYEVIGDIILTEAETPEPEDWLKATNMAPLIVKDGKINCYGDLPMTIRYYKRVLLIENEESEIPLKNWGLLDLATQIMIVLAMSNHGFDMQTESDFAQAITNLL